MGVGGRRVGITETVLRDGHQSLLATRMKTADMLPVAEKLDAVGYASLEVWGGATFDSCLRYLNEDPWERLRELKKRIKKTPLQMLLRGQNLVGYRHYPDDVVDEFVKKAVGNGVDIMRIFDALNDVRNIERALRAAKKEGARVQATVVYTISPVHSIERYVAMAKRLAQMGADSICLKDMAGLLAPYEAHELIGRLKAELKIPVQLHCHYTSGMASMAYIKAIEAGVDAVDTAISPLSMGTSQPSTETVVAVLRATPFDTGLDLGLLSEIADYFREVRKRYEFQEVVTVDTQVLSYQIPGGMITNLAAQLKQQNALDKLAGVLAEVPRVREEFGYPPLVTPLSQIVGTQAVMNVLLGERYKVIPMEARAYVRGLYGEPPGPIDEKVRQLAAAGEEVVTCRPADLLEAGLPEAKREVAAYMETEEDVLSYALFPQVALKFLKERMAARCRVDFDLADESRKESDVPYHPL